jgi:hypothetical protein
MKHHRLFLFAVMAILFVNAYAQTEIRPNTPIPGTNNFFDNAETNALSAPELIIEGEIRNPGKVDFTKIPVSTVIVKESVIKGDSLSFTGAYRYDGYSLQNILNGYLPEKRNAGAFPPQVDLYVIIENDKNEKVVFSWGEIYYPNQQNNIILATTVMRIIPEKTGELWPLPHINKMVCVNDLASERNISNPVKITIKSYQNDTITIVKAKNPVFSSDLTLYNEGKLISKLNSYPEGIELKTIHHIFYGKGRGLHSTKPYNGIGLGDWLKGQVPLTPDAIRNGLIVIVSDDGYRSVYTYSELCNRNDNAEAILNYSNQNKNGGAFRLLAGFDFFSDRAVKSVRDICYIDIK